MLQNQQRIRAKNYTDLRELLGDSGGPNDESEAVRSGRLVVIPSSHTGGERYMRQMMHDIIAPSTKMGHPDIFLTMPATQTGPRYEGRYSPGSLRNIG